MKVRSIILLAGLLFNQAVFSQKSWTAIGIKGGYGPSYLINKNYWVDPNIDNQITFGYMFGGRLSENFNDRNELSIECFSNLVRQNYSLVDPITKADSKVGLSYKTLDLNLIYRNHKEGSYFEIGPQLSLMRKASPTSDIAQEDAKTLTYFSPKNYAGVIGFGGNFFGSDNFDVLMGLRFIYSFTDIISDDGGKADALPNFPTRTTYKSTYSSYTATNPLTVLLMIEFNLDVGYFARKSCDKHRRRFVTF